MNDEDIVQLFFERSQQAVVELSKKYGKLCFHIALNILKCNEDAEECENDTYLKTWNSMPPDNQSFVYPKIFLYGKYFQPFKEI